MKRLSKRLYALSAPATPAIKKESEIKTKRAKGFVYCLYQFHKKIKTLGKSEMKKVLFILWPQLQDRESLVSLLVGARYGISQVLNHKLNMISTIIDFHYITRVELLSESERVSMLKIYLQDIKVLKLATLINTWSGGMSVANQLQWWLIYLSSFCLFLSDLVLFLSSCSR